MACLGGRDIYTACWWGNLKERRQLRRPRRRWKSRITRQAGRQCTFERIIEALGVTAVAVEKQSVLNVLSVSVAMVIQHAIRMRRIILTSVACMAVPQFSTLSQTRYGIRKKKTIEIKMYFDFL